MVKHTDYPLNQEIEVFSNQIVVQPKQTVLSFNLGIIMKKLLTIAALASAALIANTAHATAATGSVSLGVNLTSVCKVSSVPAPAFTYASFQATAATFSSTFQIMCTNTLPISSIALDQTSVTDSSTNLAYTLSLASVPTAGTGVAQTVTLNGSMPADQAGTCATATCVNTSSTNKSRTVTITY